MKTKLHQVVSRCVNLAQLNSAANYLYLYGLQVGCNALYIEAVELWENKVRELTGMILGNYNDYREYYLHLISVGKIDLANDFLTYMEDCVNKLKV